MTDLTIASQVRDAALTELAALETALSAATLTPYELYQTMLGFLEGTRRLIVDAESAAEWAFTEAVVAESRRVVEW